MTGQEPDRFFYKNEKYELIGFKGKGFLIPSDIGIETYMSATSCRRGYIMRYKIVERTQCTEYRVTSKDVQLMADQDRVAAKINPNFLIAIISTTDLQYGVTRMWKAHVDHLDIKTMVFRDRKSAEEWIEAELKEKDKRDFVRQIKIRPPESEFKGPVS